MKKIEIPIYYHEDEDGNKVYDYELMTEEFETKLSELGQGNHDEVKHFADGFHEGRWEDDIYTHDGDGKPYTITLGTTVKRITRDIHGNEYDPTKMSDGQSDFSEND